MNIHSALTHFPIALVSTSCIFELLAIKKPSETLATVARYNLYFASFMAIFAFFSGYLSSSWLENYDSIPEQAIAAHYNGARIACVLLLICASLCYFSERAIHAKRVFRFTYLVSLVLTMLTFLYTGFLGGALSATIVSQ